MASREKKISLEKHKQQEDRIKDSRDRKTAHRLCAPHCSLSPWPAGGPYIAQSLPSFVSPLSKIPNNKHKATTSTSLTLFYSIQKIEKSEPFHSTSFP